MLCFKQERINTRYAAIRWVWNFDLPVIDLVYKTVVYSVELKRIRTVIRGSVSSYYHIVCLYATCERHKSQSGRLEPVICWACSIIKVSWKIGSHAELQSRASETLLRGLDLNNFKSGKRRGWCPRSKAWVKGFGIGRIDAYCPRDIEHVRIVIYWPFAWATLLSVNCHSVPGSTGNVIKSHHLLQSSVATGVHDNNVLITVSYVSKLNFRDLD